MCVCVLLRRYHSVVSHSTTPIEETQFKYQLVTIGYQYKLVYLNYLAPRETINFSYLSIKFFWSDRLATQVWTDLNKSLPEEVNNQSHSIINSPGFKSKPLEVVSFDVSWQIQQQFDGAPWQVSHRLSLSCFLGEMRFPCRAISSNCIMCARIAPIWLMWPVWTLFKFARSTVVCWRFELGKHY